MVSIAFYTEGFQCYTDTMICRENTVKKCIGYVLFIASVMVLILMSFQTVADDIWYDEVFSLAFTRGGIKDLISLTAKDVHPPFYYIYLKLIASVLSVFPGISLITAAKLASVVPGIGLLIVFMTYIRRKYGELVMGLAAFLVITMPQIGNYYVEIRMYSLALLLITGAGLIALSIIEEGDTRLKWISFFVIGILTAYTQYYACIGIVGVYAAFLIMIIVGDRSLRKNRLLKLAASAIASTIMYIPWIPVLLSQANTINGNYWIQPLTLRSIAGCVKFITLPVAPYGKLCFVAAGLVLIAIAVIILINLFVKRDAELLNLLLVGFMPLIVIILSGFVLSLMGTPIFVYRYMVPALGLMWLGIAVMLNRMCDMRTASLLLIIPFILSGILSVRGFYLEEHKKVLFMKDTEAALDKIEDDAVIICNFDHVASVIGYRMDNDIYLYEGEIDRLIPEMLHGTGQFINDEGVRKLVGESGNVYFFGSFNSRDEILEDWGAYGITGTEQDSVLLERYWFNIYKLGL